MSVKKRENSFVFLVMVLMICVMCMCRAKMADKYKKQIDKYKQITLDDICLKNENNKEVDFLLGVGTSSYQVEGTVGATEKVYNQWMECDGTVVSGDCNGKKQERVITKPDDACEHWKRYKEDIQLIKKLGCNTYRFSIAWGKVNPKEKEFNKEALQHYEDVCKELQKNGIKPIITLYHYTHPVWFEKKGAFEKEENIQYFVDYGLKVFETLNKYGPIFLTVNTFSGVAFHAYYMGTKPPFKKDMGLALKVFKNVLNAHVGFYRKAKEQSKGKKSTIGIHKIVLPVEKYRSWQFWDNIGISFYKTLNHNAVYDFFTKGKLNISLGIPALYMKESVKHENKEAIGALDCVGLNYYSGAYMSNFKVLRRTNCIPTQSALFTIYPEGFYVALKQINKKLAKPLSVPIYVTENGIATDNEEHRDVFYRSHLQNLSKAIADGIDVRGYIAWTLMDNFDWLEGYNLNFGLYSVDRKTQERKLKEGTHFLVDVFKKHTEPPQKVVDDVNSKELKDAPLVLSDALDGQLKDVPLVLSDALPNSQCDILKTSVPEVGELVLLSADKQEERAIQAG